MICENCGLNNSENAVYCSQCGTRLVPLSVPASKKTTVIDRNAPAQVRVHRCGYPLLPDMVVCPHCQQPVEDLPASPEQPAPKKTEVFQANPSKETTVLQQPEPDSSKKTVPDKRTINPYIKKRPAEKTRPEKMFYCALQPVSRFDEPKELLPRQEFSTGNITLNRANTEPNNSSITSRQQATLTCEDGVWYIEDRSDLQTTFVHAARKTALRDGDIVLLGDREFVFSTKKQ